MFRTRLRLRKLLIPFLLFGILLTLTLIIFVSNASLKQVFYDYQVSFHGTPGNYLIGRSPNESYCAFNYGLPTKLSYTEEDLRFPPEEKLKSRYRILENVIEARFEGEVPEVTYATHLTADFVNYLAEIVRFWEGPISVAAFVPSFDASSTFTQLKKLCSCAPEMSRVTVHFVFPKNHPPLFYQLLEKPSCDLGDSSVLTTFRTMNHLMYPVNVCRNVARNLARTDFVVVTDIQLVPSEKLARNFMEMVKKYRLTQSNPPSRVYVVPVFEVETYEAIPRTKTNLIRMIKQERAVYFHRYICPHCQKFPGIKTWMENHSVDNKIKPFVSVKREYPFHRWEPIFIGGKNEPLYTESLSWEGLQDKMPQMLEMCLIGYQFVILDGAFLVHWPGIKRDKHKFASKDVWRAGFQQQNSKQYTKIMNRLRDKYPNNRKCKVQ